MGFYYKFDKYKFWLENKYIPIGSQSCWPRVCTQNNSSSERLNIKIKSGNQIVQGKFCENKQSNSFMRISEKQQI